MADVESTTKGDVYHVSYPEGNVRKITNDLNLYGVVSLNGDGGALVAVQNEVNTHIWLVPADNPAGARQITHGRQDGLNGLSWTPDSRIIYTAPDSNLESRVYIMAADGTTPGQLTTEDGRTPSVCGDGRYFLYLSYRAGMPHIWRSRLDGSEAKQLTYGAGEFLPSCSPDGTWFTYGTHDPKGEGVWRMPIEGGTPVRIWEKYIGTNARISHDGKYIAVPDGQKGVQIPAEGGDPVKTFELNTEWGTLVGSSPDGSAFLYLKSDNGVQNVWQRNLDSSESRPLTSFDNEQTFFNFAMSHDGKYLAVVRLSNTNDVVLIRDLNVE